MQRRKEDKLPSEWIQIDKRTMELWNYAEVVVVYGDGEEGRGGGPYRMT